MQGWSVRPCVRPVYAVHMTAGHHAFRKRAPTKTTHSKREFGHSGGVTERVDDAVAERGLEFCWLE